MNATFLQELAQKFRGSADFVEPFENLEQRLSSFFSKILEPAIQNPVLSVNGNVKLYDIYPHPLPDVFYGNTLTITGRYRGKGTADIEIRDGSRKGKENSYRATFKWKDWDTSESFIAPLWASRKVGHLLRQIKINGEQVELVQAVKDLSLKYNILTPYTAFLVEEPQQQARRDRPIPQMRTSKKSGTPLTAPMHAPPADASSQPTPERASAGIEGAASGDQGIYDAGYPAPATENEVQKAKKIEQLAKLDNIEAKDSYSSDTKRIGSKTFKLYQGKWIDTEYDSVKGKLKTIHVKFGTDEYFKLLASSKELAQYFAIGQQVIVVHARTIYFVD
ncbi:MAG: hypothetical protein A2Y62_08525 [Candidatus Fischerbacteria bacterium RBG_13_37_8]|uniref:Uncharacterized protein n=1 Tax=Candidatus Fischerbacteria bacterium RBG_13_37_8 TaxID=1817863 RepID=A0A1F5VXE3_9BACT|nr:MAG: hypothetical protein A2Y62_08525 [Candidatus Fischerbacteria bacterium RBG_13_37_8]